MQAVPFMKDSNPQNASRKVCVCGFCTVLKRMFRERSKTFNLYSTRTSGFRSAPAPLRHHEALNKKRTRQEKKNRDGLVDDRERRAERVTPTA